MHVAIYGGSFNPPHVGHAMVAAWLRWTEQVDAVWLVPTFAHAFGKDLLPWELRLAMVDEVAKLVEGARTCTIEEELPRPSYTIDTLVALQARHPEHRFRLVVGADVLPETPRWKSWDAIQARFPPIIVGRGGHPPIDGAPTFPEISSTEVRDRLNRGLPVDHLVPAGVARLLTGHLGERAR